MHSLRVFKGRIHSILYHFLRIQDCFWEEIVIQFRTEGNTYIVVKEKRKMGTSQSFVELYRSLRQRKKKSCTPLCIANFFFFFCQGLKGGLLCALSLPFSQARHKLCLVKHYSTQKGAVHIIIYASPPSQAER